jgi:hypothetical protein
MLFPKPVVFLFIHNHLTLRKWCYTRLLHDFPLHPLILPFHFHFRTYKRDLAIQTEWWQQRIAWWELLNAAEESWTRILQHCLLINQILEKKIKLCLTKKLIIVFVMFIPKQISLLGSISLYNCVQLRK